MTHKLTRRQVARYAADCIAGGKDQKELFRQIAQWLVETKSVRFADLLVADVQRYLGEDHNIVYAEIVAAHDLEATMRREVTMLLKTDKDTKVLIENILDQDIIGGVIVRTAKEELDASVRRQIKNMKALAQG